MDATTPLAKQLQDPYGGSIVLINKFTVALEDRDALVAAWADDAAYFKQQPGFISAQLHRGIGESPVFLNYAVWDSVDEVQNSVRAPGIPESAGAVSRQRRGIAPLVREDRGAGHLRRVILGLRGRPIVYGSHARCISHASRND